VTGGAGLLMEALRRLDAAGISVLDVALRRPTLDDVFLSLTGRPSEEDGQSAEPGARSGGNAGDKQEVGAR
jgi:ABC-2 type transport system ATP-binding protein